MNNSPQSLKVEDWAALGAREFEPVEWLVEDLIPPGVSMLSGRPKQGKSWLVHAIGLLVAAGRPVFGQKTYRSKVLYMALEDSDRRIKDRTRKLMQTHGLVNSDITGYFFTTINALRLGEGLEEQIEEILTKNPGMHLVIIDVLAKVRQERRGNQSVYESDYEVGNRLKKISARFPHVSLLIVHHNNKSGADALDSISGTHGLAGGMDNTFSLINGNHGMELHINGRDIEDSSPIPLIKGEDGMWSLISREAAKRQTNSETREKIVDALKAGIDTPKDIAAATGFNVKRVEQQLYRMMKARDIARPTRGTYALVSSVQHG